MQTRTFGFFFAHIFFLTFAKMGAHFSQMQDDDIALLVEELYHILKSLGNVGVGNPDNDGMMLRDDFIQHHYVTSQYRAGSEIPYITNYAALVRLFGPATARQIARRVLPIWLSYLQNNILTDADATPERAEECRRLLARDIVQRIIKSAVNLERGSQNAAV